MKRIALLLAAIAAVAGAGAAMAASDRDELLRYRISYSQNTSARLKGTTVDFFAPRSWRPLKAHDKRHLRFREGRASCVYTLTVTTAQAPDSSQTPAERVAARVPALGPRYVVDYGQRGAAAAWRVVRLQTSDRTTKLRAMRADHRSIGWQETTVTASSRKGDECHSGTYRAVLGPQIGNALATATGRAYDFARRG